jgi:hypothetical protein
MCARQELNLHARIRHPGLSRARLPGFRHERADVTNIEFSKVLRSPVVRPNPVTMVSCAGLDVQPIFQRKMLYCR